MHPATLDDDTLLRDCRVRFTRGSGPGGQHRNKVQTAVVLTHTPTGLEAAASERRSQAENRRVALRRLQLKLAAQVRHPVALDGSPTPLWRRRRQGSAIRVNPSHADYPAVLAEALDVVHTCKLDMPRAANWLGVSTSQLIKLIQQDRDAWQTLNTARAAQGMPPLH